MNRLGLRQHVVDQLGRKVLGQLAVVTGREDARAADLQYELFFVEDAMAAQSVQEHQAAIELNFPRLGIVCSTGDVLSALRQLP